jgi:hypothetical protein
MHSRADAIFPVFFVVWALLGIGGAIFFYGGENPGLKRKLYPYYIVLISIVFVGFTWYIEGHVPPFLAVMVVAIAFINLRATRFCNSCGRMAISRNLFTAPKYCQGCGARLDDTA